MTFVPFVAILPLTTQTSVRIIIHANKNKLSILLILYILLVPMCIKTTLQRHIARRTNDGELIANFLADTVEGKYNDAKYHHKLEATKHLIRFGFTDDTLRHSRAGGNPAGQGGEHSQFWGLIPTPEELAASKDDDHSPLSPRERVRVRGDENPPHPVHPVSFLDVLNYDIAHLIRTETADGHTIAEFLSDVMTRRDKPFTPKKLRIRHTDRMAAAREILRRGFGHFGRKRKLAVDDHDSEADAYDTLHTDLAKRMREYSQHGTDAVRFLLDVMEDANPDEPYTWHHRMSAAHELLRRGWDTNYDAITPEMLQDYWRDQQSTRLTVAQKKRLAGLPIEPNDHNTYDSKDYQAQAQELREQEEREATKSLPPHRGKVRMGVKSLESSPSKNPADRESGNPEGQGRVRQNKSLPPRGGKVRMGVKSPAQSQSQNNAATPAKQTNPPHPVHPVSYPDDKPDCYYISLNPDQQAIFDHQCKLESGDYEESEITIRQPTPEDWKAYELDLRRITEIAASEGVPLRPNPLAATLKRPTIRSP